MKLRLILCFRSLQGYMPGLVLFTSTSWPTAKHKQMELPTSWLFLSIFVKHQGESIFHFPVPPKAFPTSKIYSLGWKGTCVVQHSSQATRKVPAGLSTFRPQARKLVSYEHIQTEQDSGSKFMHCWNSTIRHATVQLTDLFSNSMEAQSRMKEENKNSKQAATRKARKTEDRESGKYRIWHLQLHEGKGNIKLSRELRSVKMGLESFSQVNSHP